MAIELANYEEKAKEAIKAFWGNRESARLKQIEAGNADQGERAGVTAGKNMDGFIALVVDIVRANGLDHAGIHQKRAVVTLPGYFRPTKQWDLLVTNEGRLIAALEFKSQVGPSFGNNFNNRAEEAIGTAADFWTAYRENAFGAIPRPFLGWIMLVGGNDTTTNLIGNGIELLARHPLQHWVQVLDRSSKLLVLGQHVGLGRLQHAVEAAQHRQRQDPPAVLGGLVVPPE